MNALKGITTALITPFYDGEIDKDSFLNLLRFQTSEGIYNFVLNGTTGESPNIEELELESICSYFHEFKKKNNFDLKLILGTGTFSTKTTKEKTKKAEGLGADAVLVVSPYYNKPPQSGLLKHFEQVAQSTSLPLILYNVPSRTQSFLELNTIKELSEISNIVGIKEATGDMKFFQEIRKLCKKDFILLSGDDGTCLKSFSLGGDGVISVASHVLGQELKIFYEQIKNKKEISSFARYNSFFDALYEEANPIGIKKLLYFLDLIRSQELRLPLYATKDISSKLKNTFQDLKKTIGKEYVF